MGFRTHTLYDERVSATRPSPPPGCLGPGDPPPFQVVCEAGRSPFVLICDHASCVVSPQSNKSLPLSGRRDPRLAISHRRVSPTCQLPGLKAGRNMSPCA